LHAEAGFSPGTRLSLTFRFDQYFYKTDIFLKAWHKPSNETAIEARYNLRDKILVNLTAFFQGPRYARMMQAGVETAYKMRGLPMSTWVLNTAIQRSCRCTSTSTMSVLPNTNTGTTIR
jgi:hypothetical protein